MSNQRKEWPLALLMIENALYVPLSKVPLAARTIWSAIALVLE